MFGFQPRVLSPHEMATRTSVPPPPASPKDILEGFGSGGGVKNIPFLKRNADAATVFSTFWLETVQGPTPGEAFLQLQYIQKVMLNFPAIEPDTPPSPLLSWPHVSVATLQKVFGGQ